MQNITKYQQELLDAVSEYAAICEMNGYNQQSDYLAYKAHAKVMVLIGITKRNYNRTCRDGSEFTDEEMEVLIPEFQYLPG